MKVIRINLKYYRQIIGLWLFKSCLLFSVFSFSGFNLQAQSAFNQSVNTELVLSSTSVPTYQLKKVYKRSSKRDLALSTTINNYSTVWALIVFNSVLKHKLKQYKKRRLHSYHNPVELLFKLSHASSEEKYFLYS